MDKDRHTYTSHERHCHPLTAASYSSLRGLGFVFLKSRFKKREKWEGWKRRIVRRTRETTRNREGGLQEATTRVNYRHPVWSARVSRRRCVGPGEPTLTRNSRAEEGGVEEMVERDVTRLNSLLQRHKDRRGWRLGQEEDQFPRILSSAPSILITISYTGKELAKLQKAV